MILNWTESIGAIQLKSNGLTEFYKVWALD